MFTFQYNNLENTDLSENFSEIASHNIQKEALKFETYVPEVVESPLATTTVRNNKKSLMELRQCGTIGHLQQLRFVSQNFS